jgi:hypothetical protein
MTDPNILYSKEGFVFMKNAKNNYSLSFKMQNNHIILPKIIDFNLVKLIYDLNNDIYEKVTLSKINDNEAVMVMLMKNIFEDLGLPQRFSYVHIKRHEEPNKICFISKTIKGTRPEGIPDSAEQMIIDSMIGDCNIITEHEISFKSSVIFDNSFNVPPFVEKMVGLILFKIFKRVKQFIENVRM